MRRSTLYGSIVAGAAAAALLVTSCATNGINVAEFPGIIPPPQGREWLTCPIEQTADVDTATIFPAQTATLTLEGGHQLDVPDDALDPGESVFVTFEQLEGPGVAVELRPHDRVFNAPLTLTLAYGGRGCVVEKADTLRIYRIRHGVVDQGELPKPPVRPRIDHVQGQLRGFSDFAVAR